jgi:hypothetical protein
VFVTRTGDSVGLELPGHKLYAARVGSGEIVFGIDAGEIRFVYQNGVFVAEKIAPLPVYEFDEFVAKQVNAFVP